MLLKEQSKRAQSKNDWVEKKQGSRHTNADMKSRNWSIPILLLAGERKSNGYLCIFLILKDLKSKREIIRNIDYEREGLNTRANDSRLRKNEFKDWEKPAVQCPCTESRLASGNYTTLNTFQQNIRQTWVGLSPSPNSFLSQKPMLSLT